LNYPKRVRLRNDKKQMHAEYKSVTTDPSASWRSFQTDECVIGGSFLCPHLLTWKW